MDIKEYVKTRKHNKGFFLNLEDEDYAAFTIFSYWNFHLIKKRKPLVLSKIKDEQFKEITSHIKTQDLAKELFENYKSNKIYKKIKIIDIDFLTDYTSETQFYAIALRTSFKNVAVIFRGTDGTIVGWKENLNMSYLEKIPAQERALEFLNKIAKKYKKKIITVAGHSKGGNLAEYSALKCNYQNSIDKVINFDGPGFLHDEIYKDNHIKNKIIKYVPEESLVGILFNKLNMITVFANKEKFEQHSIYNWIIDNKTYKFDRAFTRTIFSKIVEKTFSSWFISLPSENIEEIINQAAELLKLQIEEKVSDIDFSKGKLILGLLKPGRAILRNAVMSLISKYNEAKKEVEAESLRK